VEKFWDATKASATNFNVCLRAAHFFADGAVDSLRQPASALTWAEKLPAKNPEALGALGAANFRAGKLEKAHELLRLSLALRPDGDGRDRFYIAMTEFRLDRKSDARQSLELAITWRRENAPGSWLLESLQEEAERVILGENE
jgi:hypothetical protein